MFLLKSISYLRMLTAIVLVLAPALGKSAELTLPFAAMEQHASTYYVSPLGQGDRNGSSESNALDLAGLAQFIRELRTSARLVMMAGVYDLPVTLDLRAPAGDHLLVLEGLEGAVIKGNFNFSNETGTGSGLRLRTGNIIVRGLDFQNVGFCVKADKNSTVNQVLIENIDASDVHGCILVDRDVQQPVTSWIVRNSRIKGYYRAGIRLSGVKSQDFLLDNLQIDGAHTQAVSDCYKGGIQLLRGVSNVHIRNSSVSNNIGSCGEEYQQGDGIEADHKNGVPNNILIENVHIANSGDAELDLKANNVTMSNVVTMGGDLSRYAFKVWTYDNYQCSNCYAYGVNKAFINLNKARMKFTQATFASSKPVHICDLRHGTTPEEQSVVQFDRAQIYIGNNEWMDECGEGVLAGVTRLPEGKIAPPQPIRHILVH